MPEAVRIEAPAKLNLRLRILARETSGFHSLETVFCAVSLADSVRISPDEPGIRLVLNGDVDVGPAEQNLAVRAAERFYREIGQPAALRIELRKWIPAAAGLGGGSSDAAATLRALNILHAEPFSASELLQLGSELGSDVPFFLCGSPLALAWSRGERMLALPPPPSRPVLIAHPGEAIRTADAFRRLAELRGEAYRPTAFAVPGSALTRWEMLAEFAENDFEAVAWERVPRLAEAKRHLLAAGAEIALLSGSGASLFGVFRTAKARNAAVAGLRDLRFSTWPAETLDTMPAAQVDLHAAAGYI